ncbi:endonuclease/exonuclease/phosphatase family metal-dependent hydrolase [Actinomadura pelletieri DSM 43383]|uniref:Endonuclease/exonuclease/phosphatase family metal-dependent hydrolase n=1 Tax=Actinomadura pelletieri DSM 43383 TaxID=1120940 RepID=A0A495Q9D5_9ACTN|nr:endonuclease/exonuclease/phosphatase family protein [Actinomadura pelletieri]RKS68115.1 endonuclease/exonuclease/phosphatase family metal-dependent hydrolase [Actinomadura pelletieri DSM 43383]
MPPTTTHCELRLAYWNLHEGGLDGENDERLQQAVQILGAEDLDVVCLGEARWSERGNPTGNRRLHQVARELGMTGRYLVPSKYYRCDMAIFLKEDKLQLVEERHEHGMPWFHALARLETVVDGFGRLDLVFNHFAPSMPTIRALEAEAFKLLGKVPVIAAGDYNAVAEHDDVDPEAFKADKEHKLDRRPAHIIAEAGFIDAGAEYGNLSSTVGWRNGRRFRCDRVYHNIKNAQITGFTVISPEVSEDPSLDLSDHGGVIARLALPTRPDTPTA